MKRSTSLNRRLLLSKNFILMLVMLVVIILAVSAWFTVNKTVTANNMTVKAVSTEIDIAPAIKTYDAQRDVLTDGPGEFGDKLEFNNFKLTKDCTGDGVSLIVPEFNVTKDYESVRKNSGKEVNENLVGAPAYSNVYSENQAILHPDSDPPEYHYVEFEFYVRSKNRDLRLYNDSQVISLTEAGGVSLSTAPTATKKSAYGNFNVDGLVGAIRVSLIGQACTNVTQYWEPSLVTTGDKAPTCVKGSPVKQLLWVPRPDVKLNVANDTGDITNWTLSTGVSSGNTYKHTYYYNNNGKVVFVDEDTDPKTVVSSGTASNGIKCLGSDVDISDFSSYQTPPDKNILVVNGNDTSVRDNYYVTKYTMRVWIEGTDSEARRAMDGGAFNIKLNFR